MVLHGAGGLDEHVLLADHVGGGKDKEGGHVLALLYWVRLGGVVLHRAVDVDEHLLPVEGGKGRVEVTWEKLDRNVGILVGIGRIAELCGM